MACAVLFALGAAAAAPAAAETPKLVSEVRLGLLGHDVGPFSSRKEEGADINVELLLNDLGWLGERFSLRPHVGGSLSTAGDTSQAYFGLTAGAPIGRRLFLEFSFGGTAHNGNKNENEIGHKDLGCRVLFRESLSGGINLGERSTLSVMLDHISNANLCDKNEGLESVGVRYGYRF
jgi:lipid A 3-O-deacylase